MMDGMNGLDESLEFWLGAMPDRELAELVGCSAFKILYWRKRLGISSQGRSVAKSDPRRALRQKAIEDHLIAHQDAGFTARTFGISRQRVHQVANINLCKVWVPVPIRRRP